MTKIDVDELRALLSILLLYRNKILIYTIPNMAKSKDRTDKLIENVSLKKITEYNYLSLIHLSH
ncbi:hypothetical protein TUM4445_40040 [Shewanella sp. MBTL60-112-B2]|nr:hypothetical protein TUM4444_27410 [Shewanella sp. MBTL60-112-B1]GIU40590.1 hypothetical protein TUM4445_40040 [Shewanella sp. MBTL60-112-B2]